MVTNTESLRKGDTINFHGQVVTLSNSMGRATHLTGRKFRTTDGSIIELFANTMWELA